jgi:hypothetical protein
MLRSSAQTVTAPAPPRNRAGGQPAAPSHARSPTPRARCAPPHRGGLLLRAVPASARFPRRLFLRHDSILVSKVRSLQDFQGVSGFLARLAARKVRESFVLKGGALLGAFGNRRPTRDVDLTGQGISNDDATVLALVKSILDVQLPDDDGVEFATETATSEMIRDDDEYPGVRISNEAQIATPRSKFHIDVNIGDPIVPSPTTVAIARLMGGDPIMLKGYPLHMVLAEKIVTALQRGVANTRWRDFGDIWSLARSRVVSGGDLQRAVREVACCRKAELIALNDVLGGYADLAQPRWAAWRQRQNRDELPLQFHEVLAEVIDFAERRHHDLTATSWNSDDQNWV